MFFADIAFRERVICLLILLPCFMPLMLLMLMPPMLMHYADDMAAALMIITLLRYAADIDAPAMLPCFRFSPLIFRGFHFLFHALMRDY